ncbi:MAG: YHYH protein, partial [Planctomycetota bacterium]|nr:YHYH protein [Planctomycetota bacterium]
MMNADRWPVAVLLGPVLVCASLALAHPPEPGAPPALLELPLSTSAPARVSSLSQLQSQSAPAAGTAAVPPAVPPAVPAAASAPWQVAPFVPFAPAVRTRTDSQWLYVESDGMPHAPLEFTMMVGIRAWQQQVPIPQAYTGDNAWKIPLKPTLAEHPVSGKTSLRRGAIALAANGIPIFNALNNRGEDSFAIGELDEFGGHCGRADDYHYHAAPLALQTLVGPSNPIAFALDGFAIYGLYNPKAKPGAVGACPLGATGALDEFNGHECTVAAGQGIGGGTKSYHYHASKTYPYINGGMRGNVTVDGDEISPQAHAAPFRPALQPLRGASITGFKQVAPKAWSLSYQVAGRTARIDYSIDESGVVKFKFVGVDGSTKEESY